MGKCREIEPELTAYVDGVVAKEDRGRLEAHLERCPPCRTRVATERATHELLIARRDHLRACAPAALHRRCAAQRVIVSDPVSDPGDGRAASFARRAMIPLSLAATLVMAVALFVMFGLGGSVETYAAQLADDHVKCFKYVPQPAAVDPLSLGRTWQTTQGWPLKLVGGSESQDLQLLDLRRCGSSQGHVAHLLYRWRGEPLSVYVLNGSVKGAADSTHDAHAHDTVTALGEQAVVWRNSGRTYTVVAQGSRGDVERVAAYIRTVVE